MLHHVGKGTVLEQGLEIWSAGSGSRSRSLRCRSSARSAMATFLPNIYRSTATVLVSATRYPRPCQISVTGELRDQAFRPSARRSEPREAGGSDHSSRPVSGFEGRVPVEAVVEQMRRDIQLELKGVEQPVTGRSATVSFNLSYRGRDRRPSRRHQYARVLVRRGKFEGPRATGVPNRPVPGIQLAVSEERVDVQEARSRLQGAPCRRASPADGVNLATLERLQPSST